MRIYAVINLSGGTVLKYDSEDAFEQELRDAFSQAGLDTEFHFGHGKELSEAMDKAGDSGADVLLAGGGDGTLRYAARSAMEAGMVLAVLPLGTINIFARDIGMPMDWREGVDLIAEGVPTEIDTAEINGETFLCQCSAGLVPRLAEERENVRDESWWRSLLYLPRRFRRSVLHLRRRKMRIAFPDESHEVETWLAVVTNNRPDQPFSLMLQRGRLDRGTLAVHWAQVSSRWGLLWLLLSYILNWMNTNPQVQIRDAESVKITSDRDGLKVDLDGEIRHMQGPLHYRIRPKSLRVLMPAQKALT